MWTSTVKDCTFHHWTSQTIVNAFPFLSLIRLHVHFLDTSSRLNASENSLNRKHQTVFKNLLTLRSSNFEDYILHTLRTGGLIKLIIMYQEPYSMERWTSAWARQSLLVVLKISKLHIWLALSTSLRIFHTTYTKHTVALQSPNWIEPILEDPGGSLLLLVSRTSTASSSSELTSL